jgi:hypothetical protein
MTHNKLSFFLIGSLDEINDAHAKCRSVRGLSFSSKNLNLFEAKVFLKKKL